MNTRFASSSALTVAYSATTCFFARILAVSLASFLAVAPPATAQPTDLSNLVEQVIDAAVNISASARANTANSDNQRQRPDMPSSVEAPGERPNSERVLSSLGSGFVIDSSGIIVTNEHVIRNAEEITVILHNGTRLRAELLGEDSYIDVAVLRVQPSTPLPAVKFADSDQIRVVVSRGLELSNRSAAIGAANDRFLGGR